eukprot:5560586-Pleurochrysis_carterae.AAC.5
MSARKRLYAGAKPRYNGGNQAAGVDSTSPPHRIALDVRALAEKVALLAGEGVLITKKEKVGT